MRELLLIIALFVLAWLGFAWVVQGVPARGCGQVRSEDWMIGEGEGTDEGEAKRAAMIDLAMQRGVHVKGTYESWDYGRLGDRNAADGSVEQRSEVGTDEILEGVETLAVCGTKGDVRAVVGISKRRVAAEFEKQCGEFSLGGGSLREMLRFIRTERQVKNWGLVSACPGVGEIRSHVKYLVAFDHSDELAAATASTVEQSLRAAGLKVEVQTSLESLRGSGRGRLLRWTCRSQRFAELESGIGGFSRADFQCGLEEEGRDVVLTVRGKTVTAVGSQGPKDLVAAVQLRILKLPLVGDRASH